MPHVSKNTINAETKRSLEKEFVKLFSNMNNTALGNIFSEIFTKTEMTMISKRLTVVLLIRKGLPTHAISKMLKVSPSTVARFEIDVYNGKFKNTLHKLRDNKKVVEGILDFIYEMGSIPFTARYNSLNKLLNGKL